MTRYSYKHYKLEIEIKR